MPRAAHTNARASAPGAAPGRPAAPPTIVFSHGNGFPASTYGLLFDLWRAAGHRVVAQEMYGHDPAHAVSSNWPKLREQLVSLIEREASPAPEGVILVGHSLGGHLSLMAACMRPDLAQGVVMLDSPLVGGWRAHSVHAVKASGLIRRLALSRTARRRRHEWPDLDAVRLHFGAKAIFAAWDPRMLEAYVLHGTVEDGDLRRLAFEREIEARIYDTLPHQLEALLRRHPLRCPAAFVGGTRSAEVHRFGLALTRRVTGGQISWVAGTHLFPFERPDETAAEVLHWITAFADSGSETVAGRAPKA